MAEERMENYRREEKILQERGEDVGELAGNDRSGETCLTIVGYSLTGIVFMMVVHLQESVSKSLNIIHFKKESVILANTFPDTATDTCHDRQSACQRLEHRDGEVLAS